MTLAAVFSLLSLSIFFAWRYSRTSADPDWAYFNLWGFTGSVYGHDFVDCKTPAIHLWYLALSKLVGKDIARVKFANHLLVGSVGVLVYLITGNLWNALIYTVMVNSGWLLAFHGNVGQIPAAMIVLAMSANHSILSPALWIVAVLFEPKLAPSFAILYWKVALTLAPIGILAYLVLRNNQWFRWLWESSVVIPARIGVGRKGLYEWMPWFTANTLMYSLPWLGLALFARPDVMYWLPAATFLLVTIAGRAVRQNHLLPLIPWIALSGMPPLQIGLLCAADFIAGGFYFGNLWNRFYGALDEMNAEAEKIGSWLRDKSGTLYVNGIHSAIYIHARKKVSFGFAEQIEIRESAHERRAEMVRRWRECPPDWVVVGAAPGVNFTPNGYRARNQIGRNVIYQKAS